MTQVPQVTNTKNVTRNTKSTEVVRRDIVPRQSPRAVVVVRVAHPLMKVAGSTERRKSRRTVRNTRNIGVVVGHEKENDRTQEIVIIARRIIDKVV